MFRWLNRLLARTKDVASTELEIKKVTIDTGVVKTELEAKKEEPLIQVATFEQIEKYGANIKVISIGNVSINAPIIVADRIEHSYNSLASSSADAQIKELGEILLQQIVEIGDSWGDALESVSKDFETLLSEFARDEPREEWIAICIGGLSECAENIGEQGMPVLTTLQKIRRVL